MCTNLLLLYATIKQRKHLLLSFGIYLINSGIQIRVYINRIRIRPLETNLIKFFHTYGSWFVWSWLTKRFRIWPGKTFNRSIYFFIYFYFIIDIAKKIKNIWIRFWGFINPDSGAQTGFGFGSTGKNGSKNLESLLTLPIRDECQNWKCFPRREIYASMFC